MSLRITSESLGNTALNTRSAWGKPAVSQAGETGGRRRAAVARVVLLLPLRRAASRGRPCPGAASAARPRAQPAPHPLPARPAPGAARCGGRCCLRPGPGTRWLKRLLNDEGLSVVGAMKVSFFGHARIRSLA